MSGVTIVAIPRARGTARNHLGFLHIYAGEADASTGHFPADRARNRAEWPLHGEITEHALILNDKAGEGNAYIAYTCTSWITLNGEPYPSDPKISNESPRADRRRRVDAGRKTWT